MIYRKEKSMSAKTEKKLQVLEVIAFLGLIVIIVLITGRRVKENVSAEEIEREMLTQVENKTKFREADSQSLKKYYGINATEIKEFCLYLPASNMDATEMLIVVAKDEQQIDEIKKACEKRLEQEKSVFESYGAEQMGILNNARLESYGPYLAFIVCDDSDKCAAAFKACVKSGLF